MIFRASIAFSLIFFQSCTQNSDLKEVRTSDKKVAVSEEKNQAKQDKTQDNRKNPGENAPSKISSREDASPKPTPPVDPSEKKQDILQKKTLGSYILRPEFSSAPLI